MHDQWPDPAPVATHDKNAGFTLVELLVVLAIMGVLIALAPAAFQRVMPGLKVQAETRQLAASLRNARSAAIRDNREATLTFDLETRRYRLDVQDGAAGREHEIDSDIEVKLLTATSEQQGEQSGSIRFFPDGTSTGGRVTLAGAKAKYEIEVDWLTGRTEIVEQPE